MRLILPKREEIEKSHEDDPLDFYYYPFTGWVYRRRLAMGLTLLGEGPFGQLLEIGYGSGILLPELARRAREVHGVDLHDRGEPVERMFRAHGLAVTLRRGDIYALPYGDGSFEGMVCLSLLEHLKELDRACAEIRRVLAPGGVAIFGFPVRNAITTAFFRAVGYDVGRSIHPPRHPSSGRAHLHGGAGPPAASHPARRLRPLRGVPLPEALRIRNEIT